MQREAIRLTVTSVLLCSLVLPARAEYEVRDAGSAITISTPELEAVIRRKGYVTGVAAQSFLDKKTGFRDPGHGLDVVDWIMEPGSDAAQRPQLPKHMIYLYDNLVHGKSAKRIIEGPQICTRAGEVQAVVLRGKDFVAVRQSYQYKEAAPGRKAGSTWTQTLVFPAGKRYFLSSDRVDAVNASDAMFLRIDMPGHIKHTNGDSFSEIYLSYHGRIPAKEFVADFAPDEKFNYRRERQATLPQTMIRAYHLRDPKKGTDGPWLAGMTLDPASTSTAWCHQRGYVSFIEEFGERPIQPGQSFSAAFIVGYFDSIDEMHAVYEAYRGHAGLEADEKGWKLVR